MSLSRVGMLHIFASGLNFRAAAVSWTIYSSSGFLSPFFVAQPAAIAPSANTESAMIAMRFFIFPSRNFKDGVPPCFDSFLAECIFYYNIRLN